MKMKIYLNNIINSLIFVYNINLIFVFTFKNIY